MSLTMKELAALSGVSQSTVSLVLSGKAEGRVSPKKQEQVRKAAARYGFRPNVAARNLRSGERKLVGIVMVAPVNPFYSAMVRLLQSKLAAQGYMSLFSFWSRDSASVAAAYESVLQHDIDGIIAWENPMPHLCNGIPSVLYCSDLPEYDLVQFDYEFLARQAADHLHRLGHRKVVFLGSQADPRCKVLLERTDIEPMWLEVFGDETGGREAFHKILAWDSRPSGIIAQNDTVAISFILAAQHHGFRVPDDFSIIGLNNLAISEQFFPALSTFDTRDQDIADALVDLLLQRIRHPELPRQATVITPKFIARQSTGVFKPSTWNNHK